MKDQLFLEGFLQDDMADSNSIQLLQNLISPVNPGSLRESIARADNSGKNMKEFFAMGVVWISRIVMGWSTNLTLFYLGTVKSNETFKDEDAFINAVYAHAQRMRKAVFAADLKTKLDDPNDIKRGQMQNFLLSGRMDSLSTIMSKYPRFPESV
ncbi:hypothetical protein SARC_12567 [Sphaeroforma arctica JP610]|uniref:Uncharacterized protein n=1 Tax=Sphaeroforma arctica JP610 TaxID=667725 RepID=A0A0L0FDP3_9EUKA|nr:hypothetical protein SARC_12567 [Sphaeroforma arctica JP610]KNC74897.1 hypothetical protein SARC_12567 [Sphaeroforma arctica JP610]|eukprot:XP_014148799.1 hypothetical protein SARC_12567 [Sphaeroforma arctica JP610]